MTTDPSRADVKRQSVGLAAEHGDDECRFWNVPQAGGVCSTHHQPWPCRSRGTAPERPQTMADRLLPFAQELIDPWEHAPEKRDPVMVAAVMASDMRLAMRDGTLDNDPDTVAAARALVDRVDDVAGFMQRLRDGWWPTVGVYGTTSEWINVYEDFTVEPMSPEHAALYRRGDQR